MNGKSLLSACALALSGGACSTYPLPQDTTGSLTHQIVAHVRCEARDGLRKTAIEQLRRYFATEPVLGAETGGQLAQRLETYPNDFIGLQLTKLAPRARKIFSFYANSQIAYAFTLDLTESNIDDFNIGFSRAFSKRRDGIALGATASRSRNVKRDFNIVDTFGELALKVDDTYCSEKGGINIVYPLVGKLPIEDLISNYIEMNQFSILGGGGKDPKTVFGTEANPAIPQMGDTIIFDTKFTGSAGPTFTLNPTGMGFLLASADFKTEDYRQDRHQLIITVSTAPDQAKAHRSNPGSPMVAPFVAGRSTEQSRVDFARETLFLQREKNVDDALIQFGNIVARQTP